jgi:hypothetical protein
MFARQWRRIGWYCARVVMAALTLVALCGAVALGASSRGDRDVEIGTACLFGDGRLVETSSSILIRGGGT